MKDPVHHRKNVQKQVIRSSRRHPSTSLLEYPSSPLVILHAESLPAPVKRIDRDLRLDNDSKRKMPLDFIRRTGQHPGQPRGQPTY